MPTQSEILSSAAAGKRAFEAGLPSSVCPHHPDSSPFLARGWIRGYCLARDDADRAAGRYTFADRALIEEFGDVDYLIEVGLIDPPQG
jgi:hypothetical protein